MILIFINIRKRTASFIWNTSEYLNISLGKYAPLVFGWMIGCRSKKINN